MWEKHLQSMYQQWCQGNEEYLYRYLGTIVELVARENNINVNSALVELQKYSWFKQPLQP